MNGKSKCKILKDIRRQIAEENDISFVTSECKFQGECSGTCPKCEAEVRYLEQELEKRRKAGKMIAVAGIAAALVVGSSGCSLSNLFFKTTAGVPPYEETQPETSDNQSTDPTRIEFDGDIVPPTDEENLSDPTQRDDDDLFSGMIVAP